MPAALWTDAFLDEMRTKGDPLADEVISRLFREGEVDAVNQLMKSLVQNDGIPSAGLPSYVLDYLQETSVNLPRMDERRVEQGQDVFEEFGPDVLMALGFFSLPGSYAAKKGVQVLYRTAYLLNRPMRRVFETTQMVVDALSKGGLAPDGKGVRTAQKVRLMHASVRHLLMNDPGNPWDLALGFPLNQEDLAGTLTVFTTLVLDALSSLDVTLTAEQQESYLHVWQVVGKIMGLDERLIPANVAEAEQLTQIIRKRQIAESDEGKKMTAALIGGFDKLLPWFVRGLPASMIDYFFDKSRLGGQDIPRLLGVPEPDWTELLAKATAVVSGFLEWLTHRAPGGVRVSRFLGIHVVNAMLAAERGGNRAPFDIPDYLRKSWGVDVDAKPDWA